MRASRLAFLCLLLFFAPACSHDSADRTPAPAAPNHETRSVSERPPTAHNETRSVSERPPTAHNETRSVSERPPTAHNETRSVSERPVPAAPSPAAKPLRFKNVEMKIPDSWKPQTPANPMRVAQIEWPAAPAHPEPPQLIVFWFGPNEGGTVDANLQRWRGQFEQPGDGETSRFRTDLASVTLLDKAGTFKQQPSMMSPEYTPRPNWRMLAAVVEIEGGPFFFRAVGPDASVTAQRDALHAALRSMRPQ